MRDESGIRRAVDGAMTVARLKEMSGILREGFLRRYFLWARLLISSLPSPLKYFFEKCYPQYNLTSS